MPKTLKSKTVYICQNCGYESSQWIGQCPECKEWNTFEEDVKISTKSTQTGRKSSSKAVPLSEVASTVPNRISTQIAEFDRVLGGGLVPGQVVLLSGAPGIGKSTILTEIAKNIQDSSVLYICGEESPYQIKLRTARMNYKAENLLILTETNVNNIILSIENTQNIGLIVIDSIQTVYADEFSGIAGSISQIKGCAQLLTNMAKRQNVPLILVGHVTKDGIVAGPRLLEHIVDTVLYLEGDDQHMFRLLRTTKNRFGPVSEVGVFEMSEQGIKEVANPSELFLNQSQHNASGSAITVVMEGFRPLLFEIQALTVNTAFGYPRRTTSGFNVNRLQVLLAILEKRAGLNLSNHDVYVSIAGGFKVNEYGVDLAVCLAIASSLKNMPIKAKTVVFGECGLGGELRQIPHMEKRVKEAKKLGFTNVISPKNVKSLKQAIEVAFS